MERIQKVKRKRIVALLMVFVLTMVPVWKTHKVSAVEENSATISVVWADFSEGEPSGFVISESQPEGKNLFAKYIAGGNYNMTEYDDGLIVWINNANVTCGEYFPCEYKLSGDSTLDFGSYRIISTKNRIPECTVTETGENLLGFYNSQLYDGADIEGDFIPGYSYDYEIVTDTDWIGWTNMNSLTVKAGAKLSILCGHNEEENVDFASCINAKNVTLNGTIEIKDSNQLAIDGEGSLTVGENGKLISNGNGNVEIREKAVVSGINFYEENCETTVTLDGTANIDCFRFFYDVEAKKWVNETGQGDDAIINVINHKGATVQYKPDNGEYTNFPEGMRLHPEDVTEAQKITVKVIPQEGQNVIGIKVFYNADDQDHFDYVRLNEGNEYTFSANQDGSWNYYEIEVIDWDICMDNEYKLVSFLGDDVSFKVNDTAIERDSINTFVSGVELSFEATVSDYVYVIRENDRKDTEPQHVDGNSFTFTPNSKAGFEVCLYHSVEAYNYYSMDPGEGEYDVEIFVRNDDNTDTESSVSFTPEPLHQVSYDGRTKLIFNESKTVVVTISPDEGKQFEVNLNGEDKTLNVVEGEYSWEVSEEKRSCLEIRFFGGTPGEDPHGEDPQEEDPPVSGDPRVAVKAALENMTFAYYGNNAATIKGYFAKEIWNQLFKPDRPYGNLNIFTDETTLGSMNFLSADTSTENSEITENGVLLPYYTYTLSLGNTAGFETVTAEGRIYLLKNAMDFGVKFVKGDVTTYKIYNATGSNQFNAITVQGAYDMYEDEHHDLVPNVYFFGNGLDSLNYYSNTENRNSWKYAFRTNLTNEHTGVAVTGAAGYVAVNVVNSETKAVRINGNDAKGSAAAWSWSSFDIYETNSGTAENPREATVFVGATEIYIDSYNGAGIREITCSLDTAARAVAISTSGTSFVIKPLSNFYDELPLIITCEDGSKAYLNIKRVAMDVRYISVPGDRTNEISIFHNMHEVEQGINGNGALVSSFYYQQDRDPVYNPGASRVKLRVLYTWANGTTTQETVSPINASVQDMRDEAGHVSENGSAGVDDFILWQGDYSNAPIKAEIIAVLPSTDDNFGGALIGAGSGYVWRKE